MPVSDLQLTREPVPGKTTLLCIPGTYCSPEVFETLDEAAFPGLQLLPVSWMTSPGPWDIPTLGQRVAELIRELSDSPVFLVGHSTGGAIALAAALVEPSSIRGLLLIDTGANAEGHGDMASILKMIEAGPGADFLQMLLRRSFLYPPGELLSERMFLYATNVPREAALEVLRSQSLVDMASNLPQLTMPVVVLHGEHDQARPVNHARLLVDRLPHAELYLIDSGHTPMVEKPAEYEQAVRRLCTLGGL